MMGNMPSFLEINTNLLRTFLKYYTNIIGAF